MFTSARGRAMSLQMSCASEQATLLSDLGRAC
jgi:hypothetical protein